MLKPRWERAMSFCDCMSSDGVIAGFALWAAHLDIPTPLNSNAVAIERQTLYLQVSRVSLQRQSCIVPAPRSCNHFWKELSR